MTPLLIALLQAYANAEKAENILNGEEVVILNKRGFLEWLELLIKLSGGSAGAK